MSDTYARLSAVATASRLPTVTRRLQQLLHHVLGHDPTSALRLQEFRFQKIKGRSNLCHILISHVVSMGIDPTLVYQINVLNYH